MERITQSEFNKAMEQLESEGATDQEFESFASAFEVVPDNFEESDIPNLPQSKGNDPNNIPVEERSMLQRIGETIAAPLQGASEFLIGGGNRDRINAAGEEVAEFFGLSDEKDFDQRVLDNEAERLRIGKENPKLNLAGGLIGTGLAAVGTGGGSLLPQVTGRAATLVANPISRNAIIGGAEGFLRDPNDFSDEQVGFFDVGERAKNAAKGAAAGATFSSVVKLGGKGLKLFSQTGLGQKGKDLQLRALGQSKKLIGKLKDAKGGQDAVFKTLKNEGVFDGAVKGGRTKVFDNAQSSLDKTADQLDKAITKASKGSEFLRMDDFLSKARSGADNLLRDGKKTQDMAKFDKLISGLQSENSRALSLKQANDLRSRLDALSYGKFLDPEVNLEASMYKKLSDTLRDQVDERADTILGFSGNKKFTAIKDKFSHLVRARDLVKDQLERDGSNMPVSLRNLTSINTLARGASGRGGGDAVDVALGTAGLILNNPRGQIGVGNALEAIGKAGEVPLGIPGRVVDTDIFNDALTRLLRNTTLTE